MPVAQRYTSKPRRWLHCAVVARCAYGRGASASYTTETTAESSLKPRDYDDVDDFSYLEQGVLELKQAGVM